MGLGCQVLDQQHLSFSKTLCILSSALCRKGSQSLPCCALRRSIPILQKLQQHSKSSKQFRTGSGQPKLSFRQFFIWDLPHRRPGWDPAKSGLLYQVKGAKAAPPALGASGNPQLSDFSRQALSCPALPGSEDLIHPKGCPRASPQLRKGQHSAAGHQEHVAAGKRPTVLHRSGTWTRAARPRLTPAGPATLPGHRSVGHLQRQGACASLFTGILFTCCGPFFRCACRRVRDCLQRDSALSGL